MLGDEARGDLGSGGTSGGTSEGTGDARRSAFEATPGAPPDESERASAERRWTLLLGPGPRLLGVAEHARVACLEAPASGAARTECLSDLAELALERAGAGRVWLDLECVPLEDVGYLRRFLARHPQWDLIAIGEDLGTRAARAVCALERARFASWPPDLEQFRRWASPPAAWTGARLHEASAAEAAAFASASVASAPSAASHGPQPDPLRVLRAAQMAALAGELERDFARLREAPQLPREDAEVVADGLARLRRAAQIAYWSADPKRVRSERSGDLAAWIEERLAALTLRNRRAARFLYRGGPGLGVRAERDALDLALQAIFLLARRAAPSGDVVRVELARAAAPRQRLARVDVDFECAALARLEARRWFDPEALAQVDPALRECDLGFARVVFEALGGSLDVLRRPGAGWRLRAEVESPPSGPAEPRARAWPESWPEAWPGPAASQPLPRAAEPSDAPVDLAAGDLAPSDLTVIGAWMAAERIPGAAAPAGPLEREPLPRVPRAAAAGGGPLAGPGAQGPGAPGPSAPEAVATDDPFA